MGQKVQTVRVCFVLQILVIGVFLVAPSQAIRFTMEVGGGESQCFYEIMSEGQKYSYKTTPKNNPIYYIIIFEEKSEGWANIYEKHVNVSLQKIEVHKLATNKSTYAFCVRNSQKDVLQIQVEFHTGIQLMQFELLPDKSDTENLEREITWLEGEKLTFLEIVQKVEEQKIQNVERSTLLSTKMVVFAVVGLLSVVIVNLLFFRNMKDQFRKRKLI